MTAEFRFLPFELRADAPVVEGKLIEYETPSNIGTFTETFSRGSLEWQEGEVYANVQHDRGRPLARQGHGLELMDSERELRAAITLPSTRDGEDTATLIRSGVLRGLSVEFSPLDEDWEGRNRIIRRAHLHGLGIVDTPAHTGSLVSLRAAHKGKRWRFRLAI